MSKKSVGGFDFLKLTKSQWAHLKLIEREHGIPWHIYIRDLIKADMEGRLISPDVRERRKKLKPDITPDSLKKTLARIEGILNRPQQVVYAQGPPIPGAPPPPPNIDSSTPNIKPSDAASMDYKNPNELSDGSTVASHRESFMAELKARINAPDSTSKIDIQFSDHVTTEGKNHELQPTSEGEEGLGKKNEGKGVETIGD